MMLDAGAVLNARCKVRIGSFQQGRFAGDTCVNAILAVPWQTIVASHSRSLRIDDLHFPNPPFMSLFSHACNLILAISIQHSHSPLSVALDQGAKDIACALLSYGASTWVQVCAIDILPVLSCDCKLFSNTIICDHFAAALYRNHICVSQKGSAPCSASSLRHLAERHSLGALDLTWQSIYNTLFY